MEVNRCNDLILWGLINIVFDVLEYYIHSLPIRMNVSKSIGMHLQCATALSLSYCWSNLQIPEYWFTTTPI